MSILIVATVGLMFLYLLSCSGTVIHQHQCGEDVGRQADDGDEIGGDPGRHSAYEPLPVALHGGFEQRATRAAVAMLLQTLQLMTGQNRRRHLEQTPQDAGGEPAGRIHAPPPVTPSAPPPMRPTHHPQPMTA